MQGQQKKGGQKDLPDGDGKDADMVNKVINIEEEEIFQSPFLGGMRQYFLKGFVLFCKKQLIILIDVNRIMMQEEREEIDKYIKDYS